MGVVKLLENVFIGVSPNPYPVTDEITSLKSVHSFSPFFLSFRPFAENVFASYVLGFFLEIRGISRES